MGLLHLMIRQGVVVMVVQVVVLVKANRGPIVTRCDWEPAVADSRW